MMLGRRARGRVILGWPHRPQAIGAVFVGNLDGEEKGCLLLSRISVMEIVVAPRARRRSLALP